MSKLNENKRYFCECENPENQDIEIEYVEATLYNGHEKEFTVISCNTCKDTDVYEIDTPEYIEEIANDMIKENYQPIDLESWKTAIVKIRSYE